MIYLVYTGKLYLCCELRLIDFNPLTTVIYSAAHIPGIICQCSTGLHIHTGLSSLDSLRIAYNLAKLSILAGLAGLTVMYSHSPQSPFTTLPSLLSCQALAMTTLPHVVGYATFESLVSLIPT